MMPLLQAVTNWATLPMILTVVTPLVAVPLTVVLFYLKSVRQHQIAWQRDASRRWDRLDHAAASARRSLLDTQRDYATKEEWLRESMAARHHIERLLEAVTRLETEIEVVRGWSLCFESRLRQRPSPPATSPLTDEAPNENPTEPA